MGEFTGEFEVVNDLFGNLLVQTRNAFIIERSQVVFEKAYLNAQITPALINK